MRSSRESLNETNTSQPLGDAFFDYDVPTIRPDAQAVLAKDADWLRRWGTCASRSRQSTRRQSPAV
jgi:hypothetical protein